MRTSGSRHQRSEMTIRGAREGELPPVGPDELRRLIAGCEAADLAHKDSGGPRAGAETFDFAERHGSEDFVVVAAGERALEQRRVGCDEGLGGVRERNPLDVDLRRHARRAAEFGKIAGQSVVAILFAVGSLQFPDERGITPASPAISFLRDIEWLRLPLILVIIWVMLLIAAASNGVNLTDGLDGLASGACVMIFGAYTLVNIWQYNQSCAYTASAGPKCYEVRDPYDLAVVAIALAGACFGFLWWNAEPAKIFMGDTGSLSLGGALAGMAIFTRTELLLVILGGLLVIEVMSVILQVGFFKVTRGRRLFKMSPIHHHFELLNWAQVTIVMRFWIIAGLCVAAGLGIFYAEWVVGT